MYFINFAKCSICNQRKSVALNKKTLNKRICLDCNPEHYCGVSEKQKDFWFKGSNKK